jgi:hypothetical protein
VNEGAAAIALSEKRLREQSEKSIEKLRQRLELETHKLEDCHREIENYRAHFEQTSVQVKHDCNTVGIRKPDPEYRTTF